MLVYLQMIETESDRSKFEQLYYKYRSYMFYAAKRILQNEYDAEDAVHTAFESIAKNMDKIAEVDCPKTRAYVVIIVERKSIDLLREKKHLSDGDPEIELSQIGVDGIPDGTLAFALKKLPSRYREALLLRFYMGYSAKETADIMEISHENVRKILVRARNALQKILDGEEGLHIERSSSDNR